MKSKYWIGINIILFAACSYMFIYVYNLEQTRKFEEFSSHQRIYAKLAAKNINELFEKWTNELSYLAETKNIISFNESAKSELDKLRNILKNEINAITRCDKNGIIIYTTPFYPNSIGRDISKQKHMMKILADHQPVVSDVFNAVQGFQSIAIHYPVLKDGKFDGTIAFVLNFRAITKNILDDIRIGETGYAWMLSHDGIELYCPVPGHIGKSFYENAKGFPELLNVGKKMLAGQEGIAIYDYNKVLSATVDVKKIAYYLPIEVMNTNWYLAIASSEDEVFAGLVKFRNKLIIIFGLIFGGGLLVSYFGVKAWVYLRESEARRKAEEELKTSEERYRLLSNLVSDYVFYTQVESNSELKHKWTAGAFETITEYTLAEYIEAGGWRAALYPADVDEDNRSIEKLKNNEMVTTELRTVTKSGKIVWVKVYAYPIWNYEENKLEAIFGAVQDITERKEYEEQLKRARDKAEEMNQLKSNFLANMSHELRTPLFGLLGFSEELHSVLLNEHKKMAGFIYHSGKRLLNTLNEILRFSELEAAKTDIILTDVSISSVIEDEIKLYSSEANKKQLYINTQLCDDFIITTDEEYLRSILDNLLNNAIKFTQQGGLTVILERTDDMAIIKVQDTGIGIPSEKLQIIFEDFRQVSEGFNRNFEGSGLGLTIVKKYAEQLGGKIEVESELGKGSIFSVSLPFIKIKSNNLNKASELLETTDQTSTEKVTEHAKRNILLVEDDEINSFVILKMIKDEWNVIHAFNAKDAIERAKTKNFDAILMDINLKTGMNGLETAQAIRKINGYINTPIIAMTAYVMEKDKEDFLTHGCSHFLAKPFTKIEINRLLTEILKMNN